MPEPRECSACDARFELIRSSDREHCYDCRPVGAAPPRIRACAGCGTRVVGRRRFCELCGRERERVRLREREQTRVRISRPVTMVAEKRCSRCRKIKPAAAFYSHIARADGLAADCGECSRAHRKETRRQRRGA